MDDTQVKSIQLKTILNDCHIYVQKLCSDNNIADDHGYAHAYTVSKLAHIGLSDFSEITELEAILVMLAALMHDIDDAKIFNTQNYANANAFLDNQPMLRHADKQFVIRMISLVSYSQNKNTIPADIPKWALIPRDADRISGGGDEGITRTLAFNTSSRGRPIITHKDMSAFGSRPISRADIQLLYDNTTTRQTSLFEFYITNWYDRGVCASGSDKLQKKFEVEYNVLLDFWVGQINAYTL